jgi:hypothetical protein
MADAAKNTQGHRDRDAEYQLAGIVEVDDTYFGGPKSGGKRGRGTEKTQVIVAVSLDLFGNQLQPQFKVNNPPNERH